MAKKIGKRKMAEMFTFLDALRESGVTNMFAAPSYLMPSFDLDQDSAVNVTSIWMKTFDKDKSPADRVAEHNAAAA